MRKYVSLLCAFVLLLCGCTLTNQTGENAVFKRTKDGNLVSTTGVEYAHLADEGSLYYLGELDFVGSVQGEEKTSQHIELSYQTGMFAVKNDNSDNILIRYEPNNEWFSIYRKTSLPAFDFSADNCIRLEYISVIENTEKDTIHTTCKGGISDKVEIADFLCEVRMQENPHDAGLYDLIRKPEGLLENCYICGVIYGFFEHEPNLAIQMNVTSYNDLAYSVSIEGREYVLPESWFQKLQTTKCTH